MFIAIVVDTYIIRKEANSVAVKDLDVEIFRQIWSKYDNYSKGEITLDQLDPFLLELSQSDGEFFTYNVENMQNENIRTLFI